MRKKKENLRQEDFKAINSKLLVLITLISCSALITANFYTIKTLSATRSYITRESNYLKGHNKAVQDLIAYLFTSKEKYWISYEKNSDITQGDERAIMALQNGLDIEGIKTGFLAAGNNEHDLNDMMWLCDNFKSVAFFTRATEQFKKSNALQKELSQISLTIYQKKKDLSNNTLDTKVFLNQINSISDEINNIHIAIAKSFGDGTRRIKNYFFFINIFFTIVIVGSISFYYNRMIRKIHLSKLILVNQEEQLKFIIKDLELAKNNLFNEIIQQKKIIGSISHDISSPLKYIQLIAKKLSDKISSKDDSVASKYAVSIYKSSAELYQFTQNLIEYSDIYIEQKDYKQSSYSVYNLIESKKKIFEEISKSKNTVILNQTDVYLNSRINIRIISIILHNLVDNAVKHTKDGIIEVGAKTYKNKILYWVADNGIGMSQVTIDYYTNLFNNRDSEKLILSTYSVGLHLVFELLNILKGKIEFKRVRTGGTLVTFEINSAEG